MVFYQKISLQQNFFQNYPRPDDHTIQNSHGNKYISSLRVKKDENF